METDFYNWEMIEGENETIVWRYDDFTVESKHNQGYLNVTLYEKNKVLKEDEYIVNPNEISIEGIRRFSQQTVTEYSFKL